MKRHMYPSLLKSYRSTYPFKIASTSFIYPDHIVPNVRLLASFLDEIELLLFESRPADSLPSRKVISELRQLGDDTGLTFNVHLPLDISMGHRDRLLRRQAVETVQRLVDLTAPLRPSTHTLHLSYDEPSPSSAQVARWQDRLHSSLGHLNALGVRGRQLSIENLSYPMEWLENVISCWQLQVCLDVGHLLRQGLAPSALFDLYHSRLPIIHLYGIDRNKDHLALGHLYRRDLDPIMDMLRGYSGIVSLEVFNYDDLKASLELLDHCWRGRGGEAAPSRP